MLCCANSGDARVVAELTDLQKARADWLDAESRVCQLQRENMDLRNQVFELTMGKFSAEARAIVSEGLSQSLAAAMLA